MRHSVAGRTPGGCQTARRAEELASCRVKKSTTVQAGQFDDPRTGSYQLTSRSGVLWALLGGALVYGVLKATVGLRLSQEEEFDGADLSIHKISATPDREVSW